MYGVKSAAEFNSLQELLVDVYYTHHGPGLNAKTLAYAMDISVSTVHKKLAPNNSHDFNLRELEIMVGLYLDPRISEYLALKSRLKMVFLPDAGRADNSVDRAAQEAAEGFGDMMSTHIEARSPESPGGSGLTCAEKKRMRGKSLNVIKSVVRYQDALDNEDDSDGADENDCIRGKAPTGVWKGAENDG